MFGTFLQWWDEFSEGGEKYRRQDRRLLTFCVFLRLLSGASVGHYTVQQVDDILATSHTLGLEVIPLIQTFGHLEFLLKLPRFSALRDQSSQPCCLCPCHPAARQLVKWATFKQKYSLHHFQYHLLGSEVKKRKMTIFPFCFCSLTIITRSSILLNYRSKFTFSRKSRLNKTKYLLVAKLFSTKIQNNKQCFI